MERAIEHRLKLSRDLVCVFYSPVTRDEAITTLAGRLLQNGYVKESFGQAVLEREKEYPTGLPTKPVGVAIPHTDAEHVLTSALAVGILHHPVAFQEMGSPDVEISVGIISMMAIADPESVMPVLRNLAMAYQDHEFLSLLQIASAEDVVLELFFRRIPEVIERL